jgi:hypothetical protein
VRKTDDEKSESRTDTAPYQAARNADLGSRYASKPPAEVIATVVRDA